MIYEIRRQTEDIEMSKLFGVLLLCYLGLVTLLIIDVGANKEKLLLRPRRYLSFLNSTKFYLKINFKANMVPWNQIFAQAIGFRINWDDPPDSFHFYRHVSRRAVYNQVEMLLDRNGINGFHCIRRAICEMEAMTDPYEIYHRILKIVFRNTESAEKYHASPEECLLSMSTCPFSLLDVSRFTDVV